MSFATSSDNSMRRYVWWDDESRDIHSGREVAVGTSEERSCVVGIVVGQGELVSCPPGRTRREVLVELCEARLTAQYSYQVQDVTRSDAQSVQQGRRKATWEDQHRASIAAPIWDHGEFGPKQVSMILKKRIRFANTRTWPIKTRQYGEEGSDKRTRGRIDVAQCRYAVNRRNDKEVSGVAHGRCECPRYRSLCRYSLRVTVLK